MKADACPICGARMSTYKTTAVGDKVRRLRRCKGAKCDYREIVVVRVEVLSRKPMAG